MYETLIFTGGVHKSEEIRELIEDLGGFILQDSIQQMELVLNMAVEGLPQCPRWFTASPTLDSPSRMRNRGVCPKHTCDHAASLPQTHPWLPRALRRTSKFLSLAFRPFTVPPPVLPLYSWTLLP